MDVVNMFNSYLYNATIIIIFPLPYFNIISSYLDMTMNTNEISALLLTIHPIIDQVSMKCGTNENLRTASLCRLRFVYFLSFSRTVELNLMKFYVRCRWKWMWKWNNIKNYGLWDWNLT